MSNKTQRYNENIFSLQQSKNVESGRKHKIKKQVFGEIKNIINGQGIATPLNQDQLVNKNTSKNVLCTYERNQQQLKNEFKSMSNHKTQRAGFVYNNEFDDISVLDCFDFRGQCCSKFHKSDQQIWSEMNLYDDYLINKILDVDHHVEETIDKSPTIKENDDDLHSITKDEYSYNYWPVTEVFQEESDIHLLFENSLAINFD